MIPWIVEKRTGDTSSYKKIKQNKKLPEVLVTTPESTSIMLSYPEAVNNFKDLKLIVIDEWHELLSSKRGVLTELVLARLKKYSPSARIWGLSATLGNTDEAMKVLLGKKEGILVQGLVEKQTEVTTLIPPVVERFPWAGHLGIKLIDEVIIKISEAGTTILFTNTRSQSEIWYKEILQRKPEWAGIIAVHHGSLDRDVRNNVEELLREGKLICVVATSSLDLGVDFSPVDQIIQVGSPKGVARFLQRAGRSGHNPGRKSSIICVPTNAFELIEFAAVQVAAEKKIIEPRLPILNSLDVLSQHLVTMAMGGGFNEAEMLEEIKGTFSFSHITGDEWQWVMNFITKGGDALRAYPEFFRVQKEDERYMVKNRGIALRHRMSIGTITADSVMAIKYLRGENIGTIEESFISRLKPGDVFIFGGRALQFVRIKDMTAYVKRSAGTMGKVPQWMGSKMPLSTELSSQVREILSLFDDMKESSPELKAVEPIIEIQRKWSAVPKKNELLVEKIKTREGYHFFIYPFEGKQIHEGLAALAAFRISKHIPITFSISANDYGFELLTDKEVDDIITHPGKIFSPGNITDDILNSLNSSEMSRRQFREIARIAGLVFQGYPGSNKTVRQIQASSSLFYEVFKKYDPGNLLIKQSIREVLERQLDETRLLKTIRRIAEADILIKTPNHPTPFAFPIMINRFREKLTTEKLRDRIERMQVTLGRAADRTKITS
jgi:ATP-dependent helicase Lhr and Lhr-like helicase